MNPVPLVTFVGCGAVDAGSVSMFSAFERTPPLSRVSIKECLRLWTLQAAEVGDL